MGSLHVALKTGPNTAQSSGPHGLAVRTPGSQPGDRRFESGWGYCQYRRRWDASTGGAADGSRGPGSALQSTCLVGPTGVDARLSSGRSRVQVPYEARGRAEVQLLQVSSPRVQVPHGHGDGGWQCGSLSSVNACRRHARGDRREGVLPGGTGTDLLEVGSGAGHPARTPKCGAVRLPLPGSTPGAPPSSTPSSSSGPRLCPFKAATPVRTRLGVRRGTSRTRSSSHSHAPP